MINENKQNAALLDKLARLVNDDFMQNIDRFNIYAARILGSLYKHFPIPRSLDYKTLTAEQVGTSVGQWWRDVNEDFCDPRPPQVDKTIVTRRSRLLEWEEHSEVAWCTIQWLHDCDYIRTNETIDHINKGPCKYVLSPKGLEVLSIIPESLKPHKRMGKYFLMPPGKREMRLGEKQFRKSSEP